MRLTLSTPKTTPSIFSSIFDEIFSDDFLTKFAETKRHNMKVDVYEKDNKITIEAEIPGFKKEDIDVSLDNGYLTITAKREEEKEDENKKYYYRERRQKVVSRTFEVGDDITEKHITAKYENGVLVLDIEKPTEKKEEVKKIEIH